MAFDVRFSDKAVEQLKQLRAFDQSAIMNEIEEVLAVNPKLESKAKVKLLRQPAPAQYRLRVGEFRIFYDVENEFVNILQMLNKQEAMIYLEKSS